MATPRRGPSIERENPFRPGGDIEKEVDVILRSSTISADTITIVDPSSPQYKKGAPRDLTDTQCEDNEQVFVSVNANGTDNNDNEPIDKLTSQTHSVETNGHTTADDIDGKGSKTPKDPTNKDKPKKKKKKGCNIL